MTVSIYLPYINDFCHSTLNNSKQGSTHLQQSRDDIVLLHNSMKNLGNAGHLSYLAALDERSGFLSTQLIESSVRQSSFPI